MSDLNINLFGYNIDASWFTDHYTYQRSTLLRGTGMCNDMVPVVMRYYERNSHRIPTWSVEKIRQLLADMNEIGYQSVIIDVIGKWWQDSKTDGLIHKLTDIQSDPIGYLHYDGASPAMSSAVREYAKTLL